MKKFIIIVSFFIFMFFVGITLRIYKERQNITIVEYSEIGAEQEKQNISKKDIKDKKLLSIIYSKDSANCEFDSYVPNCVEKEMDKENYEKYYIVYFGDNSYKVIYKSNEIKYIEKYLK